MDRLEEPKVFKFYVTHVEPLNGALLKIWGQTAESYAIAKTIEGYIWQLRESFNATHQWIPKNVNELCINIIVLAKYQNERYERARVLNAKATEGLVRVHFIDYGYMDVVGLKDIRLLDMPECRELRTHNALALEFVLCNVSSTYQAGWGNNLELIRKSLCLKRVDAKITEYCGRHRLVDLNINGENVSSHLINHQFAIFSNVAAILQKQESELLRLQQQVRQQLLQEMPNPQQWQQQPPPAQQSSPAGMHQHPPSTHQQVQPLVFVFKTRILEIKSEHQVQVSTVEDGPLRFSIQLESLRAELTNMMTLIQQHKPEPLQDPPISGTVCLGRHAETNQLRRAVVNSVVSDNLCKVLFVDYGLSDTLPYTSLYQMPPNFMVKHPKVFSISVMLSKMKELNVTPEMTEFFARFVKNKTFKLVVKPPEGPPLIQYCDLYFNNRDVKDILKMQFPSSAILHYKQLDRLHKQAKIPVSVSYVDSCSNFYVQSTSTEDQLAQVMEKLQDYAPNAEFLKTSQKVKDHACAALFRDDSQWYRAEIREITKDGIKVLYVDYGNEEIVDDRSLRAIKPELVSALPAQAIRCTLSGYHLKECDKETSDRFHNLVFSEGKMTMLIIDVLSNRYLVDLYEIGTENTIIQKLRQTSVSNESDSFQQDQRTRRTNAEQNSVKKIVRSDAKARPILAQQANVSGVSDVHPAERLWNAGGQSVENGTGKSWKEDMNSRSRDFNPRAERDQNWKDSSNSRNREFGQRYEKETSWKKDDATPRAFGQRAEREPSWKDDQSPRTRDFGQRNEREPSWKDDSNSRRPDRESSFSQRSERESSWKDDSNSRRPDRESSFNQRSEREGSWNQSGPREPRNRDDDKFNRNNDRPQRFSRNAEDSNKNWNENKPRREPREPREPGYNNKRFGGEERSNFKGANSNGDNPFRSGDRNNSRFEPNSSNQREKRSFATNDSSNVSFNNSVPEPRVVPAEQRPARPIKLQELSIVIGSVRSCEMVYTNSPMDFFIHLESNDKSQQLENIEKHYESSGAVLNRSLVKVGTNCVAQFSEDQKWYRARVTSVSDEGVDVQFVDYGNTEVVPFENVKELTEEFAKLPMQAIHCALKGNKEEWTEEESQAFGDETAGPLQVHFVERNGDSYQVLLMKIVDGEPSRNFINDAFCEKKEEPVVVVAAAAVAPNKSDFLPIDFKWKEQEIALGSEQIVAMTWLLDPHRFYCQFESETEKFSSMMFGLQADYDNNSKVPSITDDLKVGMSVIAVFPDDEAMYRGEIVEVVNNNKQQQQQAVVQYVDFGNAATVKKQQIYRVKSKYSELPRQAIQCRLKGVLPAIDSNWKASNFTELEKLFGQDQHHCLFHELLQDGKYSVSLTLKGASVADTLVQMGCAVYEQAQQAQVEEPVVIEPEVVDINLLQGQTLFATVSSVENLEKFHLQLPTCAKLNDSISQYMKSRDTQVMPRLSRGEVRIGAGCIVNVRGAWRRAVVLGSTKSASFKVRLIDTGALMKAQLNCMLQLPGELAVMQNQAIECRLSNENSSPELNAKLKQLAEGKCLMVHIEQVDNNRLVVKLYNQQGEKIKLHNNEQDEKVSPICPLPILSSTYTMRVTNINSSGSLWLQKMSDLPVESEFLNLLLEHYSQAGEQLPQDRIAVNSLCAVLSADNYWYRSRIIDVHGEDESATVLFIDYGNVEQIPFASLRVLEPRFYLPHQLAVEVALSVVMKGSDEDQVMQLWDHLEAREMQVTFTRVYDNWLVELSDEAGKLTEELANKDLVEKKREIEPPQDRLEAIDEDIVDDTTIEVCISNVLSPCDFWLQRKEQIQHLQKFEAIVQMEATCSRTIEEILAVGELCLAFSLVDNQWHRAKVLDADEEITTVCFIDHGYTDVILTKGDLLRTIPDSLKTHQLYAWKCRLNVIPAEGLDEEWGDEIIKKFKNLVKVDNLRASFVGCLEKVELYANGRAISEILLEEGHVRILSPEMEIIENAEFGEEIFEEDDRIVYVSHTNSLNEFWVQESKYVDTLEALPQRLMMAEMFDELKGVKVGQLCVALFPDDNAWYRAKVLSHSANGTEVIYIDWGNTAVSTEIRDVPEDVASIPPLSRRCRLRLPEGVSEWPEVASQAFMDAAATGKTSFILEVVEDGEISIVNLFEDDESLTERLAPLCAKQQQQPLPIIGEERLPPLGEETLPKASVCGYTSPEEFWIQEDNDIGKMQNLLSTLETAESFPPLVNFQPGTICAAYSESDGSWHRAKFIQVDGMVEVSFVDYGTKGYAKKLRDLPEELKKIPPLSRRCTLRLPEGVDTWTQEAVDKFEELREAGVKKFQLEVLQDGDPTVVSLKHDGLDLASIITTCAQVKQEEISITKETEIIEDQKFEAEQYIPDSGVTSEVESTISSNEASHRETDTSNLELSHKPLDTVREEGEVTSDFERSVDSQGSSRTEMATVEQGQTVLDASKDSTTLPDREEEAAETSKNLEASLNSSGTQASEAQPSASSSIYEASEKSNEISGVSTLPDEVRKEDTSKTEANVTENSSYEPVILCEVKNVEVKANDTVIDLCSTMGSGSPVDFSGQETSLSEQAEAPEALLSVKTEEQVDSSPKIKTEDASPSQSETDTSEAVPDVPVKEQPPQEESDKV